MKCSICGKDRSKNGIITIVSDPPISICPQCSNDEIFVRWLLDQGTPICELGLKLVGFNWDKLREVYKATGVRLIKPEYNTDEDAGIVFMYCLWNVI